MIFNRRTEIVQFLIEHFKEIDGGVSPYSAKYTFHNNIAGNAFRRILFADEINDFPTICLSAGDESRSFESENLTVATLPVTIRAYVYGKDNSMSEVDNIVQDIDHVIYNIGDNPDKGILDIKIENITQDEGLNYPYGLAILELSVVYRLEF